MRTFCEELEQEWKSVARDPTARQLWVEGRERWVRDGDLILGYISVILNDTEVMEEMTPEGMADVWNELSTTAYQVMYMMTAVEARLDMLSPLL